MFVVGSFQFASMKKLVSFIRTWGYFDSNYQLTAINLYLATMYIIVYIQKMVQKLFQRNKEIVTLDEL